MGGVILPLMGLYLLLLIWVTRYGYCWARKRGWNKKKRCLGAISGFLLVYLPVFWDWISTLVMHHYYCSTEAGFWVYKTADQWKAENPGVMEGLVDNNSSPEGISPNWPMEHWSGMEIASINQQFGMMYENHLTAKKESELVLHVWRWKTELVDKKNGDILARYVDFSTGNGYVAGEPPIKFWLQAEHCRSSKKQSRQFSEFIKSIRGVKE